MHIPEQIIKDLPIWLPIVLLIIFSVLFRGTMRKSKENMKLLEDIDQRINEFKSRTFSSYEEESRAKHQLRKELLLEIQNKIPPMYQKMFKYRIDAL